MLATGITWSPRFLWNAGPCIVLKARQPLAPLGETEFVNGIAAMSASGGYGTTRVCAGIIGFADLTLGCRRGAGT